MSNEQTNQVENMRRFITKKTFKQIIFCLMGIGLVLAGVGQALADAYRTDFESFALGDVNGQFGWTSGHGSSTCPLYDVAVVSNTYGYPSFATHLGLLYMAAYTTR
jgi:hypothetical protein